MIKTLEQIQKENRKLILEAIHGCCYEEIVQKDNIDITEKPITLDRLLLALPNEQNGEQIEIELSWFGSSLIIKYHIFVLRKFYWGLEKITLEEQSEETQREINKLLNGVKICQEK